jgi:hypothetical protein
MLGSRLLCVALTFAPFWMGCGPSTPSSELPAGGESPSAVNEPTGPAREIGERLEGTWEIARYESSEPIPPEAMEVVGLMFEELTLRFEGTNVTAGGETTPYVVRDALLDDSGSAEFTLNAEGGMFDGARCRFVSDDELEVNDRGPQWAGVSTLTRLP